MSTYDDISGINDEIIRNSPIGIFAINGSGITIMENPALREILGSGEPDSKPGLDLYNYIDSDESLRKYLRADNNNIAKKINEINYKPPNTKKDLIIDIWVVPVSDSENIIQYYLFFVEDVTQRALLGSKIERAERLSIMGILASGIAEEIKYPLSHIMVNLDFVERNTSEDSPVRSYLQAIKDDLSRIKFISKQIRDLSLPHSEDDKEIYEVNRVFLSKPIKVKLNVLRERGISIKLVLPKKSPKIRANENQLIQAMTHLIQNAAEALKYEGTLLITVDSINENKKEYVSITIADTGIGITKENLANIFKPFFSTKGRNATGLGLIVSYSIIDNLGGAIGVKSTPGVGTSVRIMIPASTDD